MRKPAEQQRRHRTQAGIGSRGVRIVSGADVPRIDLEALFRRAANGDSVTGAMADGAAEGVAMTGGGAQAPASAPSVGPHGGAVPSRARTVALTDGTQITFTAAEGVGTLEPA